MNTHDIDIDLPEHDCIYEKTNESGFIDVEPAYRKSTVLRLIEADRKRRGKPSKCPECSDPDLSPEKHWRDGYDDGFAAALRGGEPVIRDAVLEEAARMIDATAIDAAAAWVEGITPREICEVLAGDVRDMKANRAAALAQKRAGGGHGPNGERQCRYCGEAPAEPSRGEPVYLYRRKGQDEFVTCDKSRYDELSSKPDHFETKVLYTAPQPTEPVKVPSDADILFTMRHLERHLKCIDGAIPTLLRTARALLARYGQSLKESK